MADWTDASAEDAAFLDALRGLRNGDFSRLEPLFAEASDGAPSKIAAWLEQGRFADAPDALAEALTCACFLGRMAVAERLMGFGVAPSAGAGTGLNALHWAVNRGQLEIVRLLLTRGVPMDTRNMYGGTVLGLAVWSAIHEPRPDHLRIIEELLDAGAALQEVDFPTGDSRIDELLRRRGAAS